MDGIPHNGSACFLRGTRIRTPEGETPVEDLAIGARVTTASGAARPVLWVGRRAYDPRFVQRFPSAYPTLIRAGAMGDGTPTRDLFLSLGHALLVDGWLVQAELLENGATVARLREWRAPLEYFHVELGSHDVIFAEGLASESFNDCDNRGQFQNADEFWRLYPDFRAGPALDWAKRLISGPPLKRIRARMLAHAAAQAGQGASTSVSPSRQITAPSRR